MVWVRSGRNGRTRVNDKSTMGVIAVALLLNGCAGIGPQKEKDAFADPRDPWERYNRDMFAFNESVDQTFLKPLARGYKNVMPEVLDRGVTNFFTNLDDVTSIVSNLLQFKLRHAASDFGRVTLNSTVGLLGFFDVATNMNLPRHDEDFGQAFGAWGIAPGPYLVLPVIGPSSARDGVGFIGDWLTNPTTYVEPASVSWGLRGVELIDLRADLLGASRVLDQAALDRYEFVRDAYLQKRRYEVYDGNPPLEDDFPE